MDEDLDVENFPTQISEVVHAERNNLKIEKLKANFYQIAKKALERIHREMISYLEEGREDDWMYTLSILKKCKNQLETLVNMRIKKIFTMAWAGDEDISNLTPEEKKLYMDFKDLISKFKNTVMGEVIAEEKFEKEVEVAEVIKEEQRELEAPEEKKEEYIEETLQEGEKTEEETVLLYVLQNFPRAFASAERNYRLRKEDVLIISKPFGKAIEDMGFGKIFKLPRL